MNATRNFARGVGPFNIRVNSIHPSWMWNEPVIKYSVSMTGALLDTNGGEWMP
jgi:NAD(P)-dependent dehydrogenase (short-subunit alcohol dehydrogenase family)